MFGNKNSRIDYLDEQLSGLVKEINLLKKILKIVVKDTKNDNLTPLLGWL